MLQLTENGPPSDVPLTGVAFAPTPGTLSSTAVSAIERARAIVEGQLGSSGAVLDDRAILTAMIVLQRAGQLPAEMIHRYRNRSFGSIEMFLGSSSLLSHLCDHVELEPDPLLLDRYIAMASRKGPELDLRSAVARSPHERDEIWDPGGFHTAVFNQMTDLGIEYPPRDLDFGAFVKYGERVAGVFSGFPVSSRRFLVGQLQLEAIEPALEQFKHKRVFLLHCAVEYARSWGFTEVLVQFARNNVLACRNERLRSLSSISTRFDLYRAAQVLDQTARMVGAKKAANGWRIVIPQDHSGSY